MEWNEITPKNGKFYRLTKYSKDSFEGYVNMQGRYMGFYPNRTGEWSVSRFPEGHIFAVKEGETFKIYHTRTDRLTEKWISEGEDGPEYAIGIAVTEWEGKLREVEIEFLEELFAFKEERRQAA